MQSICSSSTRLLHRNRFSTLFLVSLLRLPQAGLRMNGAAKYLISSLTKAISSSSSPIPMFTYSSRCFPTIGDSIQSTPQGLSVSAPDVPPRIKFKRLGKTAKHIVQTVDKEAVEEVRNDIALFRTASALLCCVFQSVKGIVIARRNAGLNSTFRIIRLVAGVGVESRFPLYSPNLREIKVLDKKSQTLLPQGQDESSQEALEHPLNKLCLHVLA